MPQSGEGGIPRSVSYRLGPFAFYTALDIPELPTQPSNSAHGIPVSVLQGTVPSTLRNETFRNGFCVAAAAEILLDIPEVARYFIRDGAEITIEPYAGSSPLDVRGFLLGNVFAVLCHQRGLLPLHASAVKIGDGVVAFLGSSGAGKSTLAALLSRAGYPLVADDICLLDPAAALTDRVLPVAPWLKLWRASLEALGQGTEGLSQTFSDEDKFRLPIGRASTDRGSPGTKPDDPAATMPSVFQDDTLPLRAVVVLQRRAAGTGATLTPLNPLQAIGQVMKFTYQAFLLDWLGLRGEHFTSCGKALEGAKAYSCERAWGFDSFPEILARLREEFD